MEPGRREQVVGEEHGAPKKKDAPKKNARQRAASYHCCVVSVLHTRGGAGVRLRLVCCRPACPCMYSARGVRGTVAHAEGRSCYFL